MKSITIYKPADSKATQRAVNFLLTVQYFLLKPWQLPSSSRPVREQGNAIQIQGSSASSHKSHLLLQSLSHKGQPSYIPEVLELQQMAEAGLSFKGISVGVRKQKKSTQEFFPCKHHSECIFLNFKITERLRLARTFGGHLLHPPPEPGHLQLRGTTSRQLLSISRDRDTTAPSWPPVPVLSQFAMINVMHRKTQVACSCGTSGITTSVLLHLA